MGASVLPSEKMAEAEVSLRLALHLLRSRLVVADVEVAIDGAQVQTNGVVHFPIREFLADGGVCKQDVTIDAWQGLYSVHGAAHCLRIHSTAGLGDVVAPLQSGRTLRAESKKGPLVRKKGSPEYRLLREALGQLLTVSEVGQEDLLAVAVPHSPKFKELTDRWSTAPLVSRLDLRFLLVGRDGGVLGLP